MKYLIQYQELPQDYVIEVTKVNSMIKLAIKGQKVNKIIAVNFLSSGARWL